MLAALAAAVALGLTMLLIAPAAVGALPADAILGTWHGASGTVVVRSSGASTFEGTVTATDQCPSSVPYVVWTDISGGEDGSYRTSVRWFAFNGDGTCSYVQTDPNGSLRLEGSDTLVECSTPPQSTQRNCVSLTRSCPSRPPFHVTGVVERIIGTLGDRSASHAQKLQATAELILLVTPVGEAAEICEASVLARQVGPIALRAAQRLIANAKLGRIGEAGSGILKNTKRIWVAPGKYRIPDVLDPSIGVIGEVKNVARLSYTKQLRDYLAWAKAQNPPYLFYLWVRPGTRLSGPLWRAVRNGDIHLVPLEVP
jgi:hypothetical protein